MYQSIPPSEGFFVGLRIQDDLSRSEEDEIVGLIEKRFARSGPIRLLIVYDADPGLISAENLYENMRFAKVVSEKLARMAVIGRYAWEDTWVALFGLFGGIKTRYFRRGEIKEALAWLSA
jgi:hypothetical protein